ncbi:DNA cytosine methyltransferase [Sporosarcina sp. CAU 1771]
MNKPKVVSLFSGAGGMDLGFINAGFEVIWASDIFIEAVNTYKKNIGPEIELADLTQVDSKDIPDGADVIIGGFPCQGFSIANSKRNEEDKRNFLYLEMLRIVKDKQPKFFVAENVKGIMSLGKGKVLELIKKDFEEIGYKVDAKLLNAAEYGVPQARERVIILGNRIGQENKFPLPTHYLTTKRQQTFFDVENFTEEQLLPAITTQEAIGHLADIPISFDPIKIGDKTLYNHIASTNVADTFWGRKYEVNQADICDYLKEWRNRSEWTTNKIDKHFGYRHTAGHWFRKDNNSGSIPKPHDWWELKKLLKFDDKYDKEVTTMIEKDITFEQSLRITNWDTPSDTITATSPEIHVNKDRRLTVRETAILQSFPDDFIFEGSLHRMYTQIGNAVPVLLAQRIAETIKPMLEKGATSERLEPVNS